MTLLQMLQHRCGFRKNLPRPLNWALRKYPKDLRAFFRTADGGTGTDPYLLLYRQQELEDRRSEFLEQIREEYRRWILLESRELNPEEEAVLDRIGTGLTVLGECADPEQPDYLCHSGKAYFLVAGTRLEDLLRDGGVLLYAQSYSAFLDRVLRCMEVDQLGLEMPPEE